jgi:hypothetical protein
MQNEAEMVEFEQDRRMVVDVVDAPMPARIVIDFTPVDGGTSCDVAGRRRGPTGQPKGTGCATKTSRDGSVVVPAGVSHLGQMT